MYRNAVTFLGALGLTLFLAGPLLAQDWPAYPSDLPDRGPGQYLAWYKLLACWLFVLCWVRTTDWINHDSIELGDSIGLPTSIWNPITVFTFLASFIVLLIVPMFAVGIGLLAVCYIGPLATYIIMRNGRVTAEQKVLTPSHLKMWFTNLGSGRKRKKTDSLADHEQGPPVKLTACGGTDAENQAHLIIARQSPGYVTVKELIADAIGHRVSRVMLDYTKDAVAIRYDIDGVWHALESRDRESGDVMLAVMKKISSLNMDERRAKQDGEFRAALTVGKVTQKFTCQLVSQGTKTGERAILKLLPDKSPYKTLEDLGMREKMVGDLKGLLGAESGLFLFTAMPMGGLQTSWNVGLTATDRYLRDFLCLEDKTKPWTHVENVEVFTWGGPAESDSPEAMLRKVLLREPDVLVVPEILDGHMLDAICNHVVHDRRLAMATLRAKEGVEAIFRALSLGGDAEKFAQAISGILNQRLVRLLCETCRQAYEPTEELLTKLGVPKGRVPVLYREYQPPPPDAKKRKGEPEICPDCNGLGYRGRTAIFELIKITDQMRTAITQQPRIEVLRQVARAAGAPSLQEEGVLLVVRGATSLTELQRVLKQ